MQEHYLNRHMPAQVAVWLRYVDQQSFLLDLKIIVQTFFCILIHSWLPPKKRPVVPEPQGHRNVNRASLSGGYNRRGSNS